MAGLVKDTWLGTLIGVVLFIGCAVLFIMYPMLHITIDTCKFFASLSKQPDWFQPLFILAACLNPFYCVRAIRGFVRSSLYAEDAWKLLTVLAGLQFYAKETGLTFVPTFGGHLWSVWFVLMTTLYVQIVRGK